MHFIMLILLFVAPPTAASNRPWALQSTQSVEFDSFDACDDAIRNTLLPAVKTTDTVSLFGWCIPKDFKGKDRTDIFSGITTKLQNHTLNNAQLQAELDLATPQVGSCYYYVPAPVDAKNPKAPIYNGDKKLLGTCGPQKPPQ